jgi:prolyl-tRNA editing enzyme YbaK/EbsC (Cys-tRNA(Pro) deacylase)
MWPPEVEEVAAAVRTAGVEARLEELAEGERLPPGPAVRAEAYDCEGRLLVALLPSDQDLDPRKLLSAAGCVFAHPSEAPQFPFTRAAVFVEQLLLGEETLWIRAGSPRHVLAVSPSDLVQLTRAQTVDLAADD